MLREPGAWVQRARRRDPRLAPVRRSGATRHPVHRRRRRVGVRDRPDERDRAGVPGARPASACGGRRSRVGGARRRTARARRARRVRLAGRGSTGSGRGTQSVVRVVRDRRDARPATDDRRRRSRSASAGDVVVVPPGIHQVAGLRVPEGVTVRGEPGAALDGGGRAGARADRPAAGSRGSPSPAAPRAT